MPFWESYYHLVWGTKNRFPLITASRQELIRLSIAATCTERQALIHAVGMMPDHIHLAVSIPPRFAVADFVQWLKGASTRRINQHESEEPRDTFAWQAEYGMLTFGEKSLSDVVAYIENQERHHAEQTLLTRFEQLERHYTPPNQRPITTK
jgi:putative transposase